jgi:hypothetical protein
MNGVCRVSFFDTKSADLETESLKNTKLCRAVSLAPPNFTASMNMFDSVVWSCDAAISFVFDDQDGHGQICFWGLFEC